MVEQTSSTNKVVVIMGEVGAGKSTFANMLTGKNLADIGDDPDGVTKEIKTYYANIHGQEVLVADLPGFGDIDVSTEALIDQWNKTI